MNLEKVFSKDFEWKVDRVDRELGHVYILDGEKEYKWFMDGQRRVILVNGDERNLAPEKRKAMKLQVRAILGSEIPSRAQ